MTKTKAINMQPKETHFVYKHAHRLMVPENRNQKNAAVAILI